MTLGLIMLVALVYGFLSAALGFMPVYWIGALVLVCGGWLMAGDARQKPVTK